MNKYIEKWLAENENDIFDLMKLIWSYRETALKEFKTCALVADYMRKQGFMVETLQAEKEGGDSHNTVIATYGSGKPVIAVLGEFDALPGLGSEAVPYYAPLEGPGHACGHHLMAGAGVAGACALRYAMEKESIPGTLRFYGCPAEETLQGKVFLARRGLFNGCDVCTLYHPGGFAGVPGNVDFNAITSIEYIFQGKSAHGVRAEQGRSALDAAELVSIGSQYLREHMTEDCRIHHIYTEAGKAPNIVPDKAAIYFFIRSLDWNNVEMVRRMDLIANAAAMMTETTVTRKLHTACHGFKGNLALAKYIYEAAQKVPALDYTEEDYAFAKKIYREVIGKDAETDNKHLLPTQFLFNKQYIHMPGSIDLGDTCRVAPAIQFGAGGMVAGLPTHHWNTTATTGTHIGYASAIYAAAIHAQFGYDALHNPQIIADCWEEFYKNFGENYKYTSLVDEVSKYLDDLGDFK